MAEEEDRVIQGGHQEGVNLEDGCSAEHPDTLGNVDSNGFILRTEKLPRHSIAH